MILIRQEWEKNGWTKTNSKTVTKTLNQGSYEIFLEILKNGDVGYGVLAVPFELKVGESMTCFSNLENYKSSDETVLKIENGKIKAVGVGTAKITASFGTVEIDQENIPDDILNSIETEPGLEWTGTVKAKDDLDKDGGTTDFSNAKYSWSNNEIFGIDLIISDIKLNNKSFYKYEITESKDITPTKSKEYLTSQNENSLQVNNLGYNISLNQDIYLWIWENDELVLKGQKITKPEFYKGIRAWDSASFITYLGSQILLNQPVGDLKNNPRKMNVKIGRISDNSLMKKLKENPNSEELLTYAKTSEKIYDNTIITNWNKGYSAEEILPNFDSSKLIDEAYYFVYVELDGENGKYIPVENVTFAQADTYIEQGSWFLFLYGSNDFKWSEDLKADTNQDDKKVDNTQSDKKIPQTGTKATITIAFASIVVIGILGYLGYRRYNEIK